MTETAGFSQSQPTRFPQTQGRSDNIGRHLTDYINGFSENIRKIFERSEFDKESKSSKKPTASTWWYRSLPKSTCTPPCEYHHGLVFEDLIRRFNEAANETVGDHFTPREVIRLMVNLLLVPDTSTLTQAGKIVTICDPACGTGGMLAESQN